MEKSTDYLNALASRAFDSKKTLGRERKEDEDLDFYKFLDPFDIDIYKIKSCKSFRSLSNKTQVWPLSKNPLIRHRLSHTMEVEAVAVIIARTLGLNVSLASAIALAHDLGHAPFGHLFERVITAIVGVEFRHGIFGAIMLQKIERQGRGVNLSFEVMEGVSKHSGSEKKLASDDKLPLEYAAIACADKIAFLFSDVNDTLRTKYVARRDLPEAFSFLGANQRAQVNSCLVALFKESAERGTISFSDSPEALAFEGARQWMYKNVYCRVDKDPDRRENENHICQAYSFMRDYFGLDPITTAVAMATMTDREVIELSGLKKRGTIDSVKILDQLGFMEFLPYCQGIGFTEADLTNY